MRRYGTPVKEATKLSIQYLKYQKKNIEKLKVTFIIRYEELVNDTTNTKKNIVAFLPELNDINMNMNFSAHNSRAEKNMAITNLNLEKIAKIKKDDLLIINSLLKKEKSTLNYFNYHII